jgi:hypothetical protein
MVRQNIYIQTASRPTAPTDELGHKDSRYDAGTLCEKGLVPLFESNEANWQSFTLCDLSHAETLGFFP